MQLAGATAALAMIGLGQICQLKINSERLCYLISLSQIHLLKSWPAR